VVSSAVAQPLSSPAARLIPAAHCADVVHDSARGVLYITAGDQLLRYHLGSNALMTPLDLGGSLAGIDLSPDGRTLAIADRTRAGGQVWIHLYDINTGTNAKVLFARAPMEGGTYSVAFGSDGAVYVTSTFEGSGTVPWRRYEPATRNVSELRKVNQNTMLSASANRHVIAFAEANTSAGTYGAYDVRTKKVSFEDRADRFLWEIAANRDGTQFAIPTYQDTIIHGADPRAIGRGAADGRPIGAVFHPARDIAFFAWSGSTTVRAFDARTWRELDRMDVGVPFESTGNRAFVQGRLRMSQDGSWLFCTVNGGVCPLRPRLKEIIGTLSADRR
jgi:WD40 repeat protein